MAEENTDGLEKRSALVEGHEVRKAWKNDVVVVTVQVMLPVPTKQISEKTPGVEEEVFVCLGQVVLTRQIDDLVMLSKTEAVKKAEEWEASVTVLVMATAQRLKAEAEAMEVEAVVEK